MRNPLYNKIICFVIVIYMVIYFFSFIFIFIERNDIQIKSNSIETYELKINEGEYIRWKCHSGDPIRLNLIAIEGNTSESVDTGVYYGRYHWGEYTAKNDAILHFSFNNSHDHKVVTKIEVNYNLTGVGLILQIFTFVLFGIIGIFLILIYFEIRKKERNR